MTTKQAIPRIPNPPAFKRVTKVDSSFNKGEISIFKNVIFHLSNPLVLIFSDSNKEETKDKYDDTKISSYRSLPQVHFDPN